VLNSRFFNGATGADGMKCEVDPKIQTGG
jgi:hypothetical protein